MFKTFSPQLNIVLPRTFVINNPKKGEVYGGKVAAPIFKELSDKVFALDMNIHKPIVTLNNMKDFPTIKNGNSEEVYLMLNQLNIQSNHIQDNYVNATISNHKIELFANIKDKIISEISFQGDGCAISIASASILTQILKGKNLT